jgi:hypothetical protein
MVRWCLRTWLLNEIERKKERAPAVEWRHDP